MNEWLRPLLCLLIILLTFSAQLLLQRTLNPAWSWRATALQVFISWGVFVWGTTEGLSLFHALTPIALTLCWGAWIVSLAGLSFWQRRGLREQAAQLAQALQSLSRMGWLEWGLSLGAIVLAASIGFVALWAAPNNWDSMVYHLSRVMYWQQNQSVAFYPTPTLRQLHTNPGAEYALLHLQLLTGSDRLANLVQFGALVGSVIGVSLVTQLLGGQRRAQWLAGLFTLTIPMGILQATSTQNDYVAGFWLVCFVYFGLQTCHDPKPRNALLTGASLGLTLLTKATLYFFAAPFVVWFGGVLLRKWGWAAFKPGLLIGAVVLLINVGHYYRNTALYGSPFGPDRENNTLADKYTNDVLSPAVLVSNVTRNLALQVGVPDRFINLNGWVQQAVLDLHKSLGLDILDPRTTWGSSEFGVQFTRDENTAGNPLHLALTLLGMVLLIGTRWRRPDVSIIYSACLAAGFLLFCLVLRWQPWNSRLHLPLFILAAVLIGLASEQFLPRWLGNGLALAALLVALPFVYRNATRPLVGQSNILTTDRISQMFFARPELQAPYQAAMHFVIDHQCTELALWGKYTTDWDYPLWPIAQQWGASVRIEPVLIDNISGTLPVPYPLKPCAVLATARLPATITSVSVNGVVYNQAFALNPTTVFLPATP